MNKSKTGKKLLSLLLSVLMCLSFVPTVAFATTEEGETEGSTNAENYTVDENGNVTIYTEDGLFWFAEQVNGGDTFSGKTVTLENDIALTKNWTPIGSYGSGKSFRGTFNGNARTISNMSIISSGNGVGFFGETFKATIKNLTIEGNIEAYMNYVGGIVGHGYATIENCVFKGNISGSPYQAGGIAGSGGFTITNCSVYGNIHANTWAGGIVGNCQDGGAYTGCYVEGEISSDNTYWGGGAAGITPVPLYPTQVISGCYSNTVVKVAGEEVNCPIIAAYNNPLNYNGYTGDIKIYDNSWNKQKNSNDSYPLYAEENGEGGVLMEGKDVARDNNLVMIEDDLNYISGNLENVRIMNGSKITREQIEGKAVAEVNGAKYATLKEAVAAAKTGDTVTLLADISLDEQIEISQGITIDGQGKYTVKAAKKLVGTSNKSGMFYRIQSAKDTLTFLNVTLDGNGVSKIFLNEGGAGETVFDGVTSINGGGIAYGSGIHISGGGSHATIKNSTLTGSTGTTELDAANYYAANDLWVGGNVYVTVENSTIGKVFVNSAPSAKPENGVVHGQLTVKGENTVIDYISGEKEKTAVDKYGNNGSLTKIESGTVNEIFDMGCYEISGGTFETEIKPEWCADGFIPVQNDNGTYGVKSGSYVAEVNDVKFETLQAAVAAAENGDTVKLLSDVTEDIAITKNITLDLGGKTLTGTGAASTATLTIVKGAVATVKNGNVVGTANSYYNIQNNGTAIFEDITATAGNTGSSMIDNWGTLTINSGNYTGGLNVVKSEEGSKLTITGGKFTLSYSLSNEYNAVILVYGDTTISGGEFIQSLKTPAKWAHPQVVATGIVEGYTSITRVTGGTFINNSSSSSNKIFHNLGKAGYANFEVSGGTFNKSIAEGYCADGFIPTKNSDGTYGVKEGAYVAAIGSTGYETLADAVKAAKSGKTIKLLADCYSDRINLENKNIKLVLDGHTVTSTAAYGVLFCVKNGNTITIDGTAEGSKVVGTIMITEKTYGHIVINGGTYESALYCPIYVNGAVSNDESTVTITNAVITALNGNSDQDNGVAAYLAGYAVYKFENCTITAPVTGIEIRAGKLDLINCNVTGGNGAIEKSANGNGTTVKNAALAISQHNTVKNIEVNISGGTYTGTAAVYQTNVQGTGSDGVKVNISSGTFNGLVKAETTNAIAISGGTFSSAVPADYCAAGYAPKTNNDGTYGVEHKATTGTRNLSVDINGYGTVDYSIIGGVSGTWDNSITNDPHEIGTQFTLKAIPGDGFTFLYWVNSEGRVLTDNLTYNFYLGDNLTIKAVFCKTENSNAYVIFRDRGNTILKATSADSEGYIDVPTNLIDYAGYTFMGWYDADGKEYIVTDGKIQVSGNTAITIYARYKADTETVYTVTVDGEKQGEYTYGSYVTVTAEDIEGKEFAGWYINGTLVSYDKAYSFYVTGDVALEASYSDTVVVKEPVVTLLVSARKDTADGKQSVILTASWSADSSYTFVGAGIILSQNADAELTLENVDGKNVVKTDTRLTSNDGTYAYTLTLGTTAKLKNVYAVAYFTFIKDGKVVTIYTTVQISEAI